MPRTRCAWAGSDPLMIEYHDDEWGVPLHDDRRLFEMLTLEGAQAGLSWITILRKRPAYRKAFARFDPGAVARFDRARVRALLADAGIVRNRLKIESAIANARAVLEARRRFGSLDSLLWGFVDGRPVQNAWRRGAHPPAETPASRLMSKALRASGFRFVGPTICYAFMQATGMVNDHAAACFRRGPVSQMK